MIIIKKRNANNNNNNDYDNIYTLFHKHAKNDSFLNDFSFTSLKK